VQHRFNKAQSSIEMVVLAGIILILSALILGNYFSISDSTNALIAAKNAILERQSATDIPFHVESLDYATIGPENIDFSASIPELDNADIGIIFDSVWCDSTKEKISKVGYKGRISFAINSGSKISCGTPIGYTVTLYADASNSIFGAFCNTTNYVNDVYVKIDNVRKGYPVSVSKTAGIFPYQIEIPASDLPAGPHQFEVVFTDACYSQFPQFGDDNIRVQKVEISSGTFGEWSWFKPINDYSTVWANGTLVECFHQEGCLKTTLTVS